MRKCFVYLYFENFAFTSYSCRYDSNCCADPDSEKKISILANKYTETQTVKSITLNFQSITIGLIIYIYMKTSICFSQRHFDYKFTEKEKYVYRLMFYVFITFSQVLVVIRFSTHLKKGKTRLVN